MSLRLPKEQILALFAEHDINPNARPADLGIEDWCKLEKSIKKS